ncbi:MAG TPA: GNAT family N-acetyltransferase [Oscillospiraceae bacterium]|nr:GNAT family N-acetyltransferase [Oscillospiraceae bacterium]
MKVELRSVTENELELLMNWRMRPDISQYMMNDVKLTMEMQRKWYEKLKTSDTQLRWIVWVDDVPIGSIYLLEIDHKNKNAELGVFIAETQYRNLKMLLYIHWNLFDYVFSETDLHRLYGCIMEGNEGMIRFNIANGSEVEGTLKEHIYKNGKFHNLTYVGITKDRWAEFRETVKYDVYPIEKV